MMTARIYRVASAIVLTGIAAVGVCACASGTVSPAVTASAAASSPAGQATSVTFPASPVSGASGHLREYAEAIAGLRQYLAMWHERGQVAADQRYKVPSQRLAASDPRPVILSTGKVVSYRPVRWVSGERFTLLVTMDLRFSGSQGAWNQGSNDRFVTFYWAPAQDRYLMEFATSPPV